jgi:GNAT superfamily N-acetyltransferase
MPERRPDGLILPYSDDQVCDILIECDSWLAYLPMLYEGTTPQGYRVTAITHAGNPEILGPVVEIAVWVKRGGQLIGYGRVERDIDFEDEVADWGPAWVAQSLFVHPDHQRRGIGTTMLRMLRSLTGLRIAEDTQMTRASTDLWDKLLGELWAEPGPQDATDDPAILAFRATANDLVAAAKARYQAS